MTHTTQPIDTDGSHGLPEVYPTAPLTVSRDCAGWAYLALDCPDMLKPEEREQAIAELKLALWPELGS